MSLKVSEIGKIILYGELARRAGVKEVEVKTAGRTLLEILKVIARKYGLEELLFAKKKVRPIYLIIVDNKDYLSLGLINTRFENEKVIKIIPVVHGG